MQFLICIFRYKYTKSNPRSILSFFEFGWKQWLHWAQFVTGYVTNTCFTSEKELSSFVFTCTDSNGLYVSRLCCLLLSDFCSIHDISDAIYGVKSKSKLTANSACVPTGDLNGNVQTEYGLLSCYNTTTPELIFISSNSKLTDINLSHFFATLLNYFSLDNSCRNFSLCGFQGVFNDTCIDGAR